MLQLLNHQIQMVGFSDLPALSMISNVLGSRRAFFQMGQGRGCKQVLAPEPSVILVSSLARLFFAAMEQCVKFIISVTTYGACEYIVMKFF